MRYVNGFLCLVMLLFAAVQYNDPDFYLWVPIYLVPAAWAGVAAWRPALLRRRRALAGLAVCLAAALVGAIVAWPAEPGWWQQDVWWDKELVREGMGVMIVTAVLCFAALGGWLARRRERV